MLTITIDTNVINARGKDAAMNQLEQWYAEGKIGLFKTDVMDTELQDGYRKGLEKAVQYKEDLGVGVWGSSRWGHALWASEEDGNTLNELKVTLFGKKSDYTKQEIRDAMALLTHSRNRRDFFVTNDAGILDKKEALRTFGISVGNPVDCVAWLLIRDPDVQSAVNG